MKPAEYKRLRVQVGSQADVADMLGVSRETVNRREAGKRPMNNEAVLAIRYLAEASQRERERHRRRGPRTRHKAPGRGTGVRGPGSQRKLSVERAEALREEYPAKSLRELAESAGVSHETMRKRLQEA